jgi:imidazolonepropionase-like amidohydrolase
MQDSLGTIEPGKLADIVAVPADPLADVSGMEKVDFVMEGRSGLPQTVISSAQQLPQPRSGGT